MRDWRKDAEDHTLIGQIARRASTLRLGPNAPAIGAAIATAHFSGPTAPLPLKEIVAEKGDYQFSRWVFGACAPVLADITRPQNRRIYK